MTALLLSPHNDDAALFAAFTCFAEKPHVVTVLRSMVQERRGTGITFHEREAEDAVALTILGCASTQWDYPDDRPDWDTIRVTMTGRLGAYDRVYAPLPEGGGHEHHNRVGELARDVFGGSATRFYATYTSSGKSTAGTLVEPAPGAVAAKLAALACYRSQSDLTSCQPHFLRGLDEYLT